MSAQYDARHANVPAAPPGLGNDLDMSLKRLSEIRGRLETIGDSLYGSRAEFVGAAGINGRPVTSLFSRVGDLTEVIGDIETAVNRIGEGL